MSEKERLIFEYLSKVCRDGSEVCNKLWNTNMKATRMFCRGGVVMAERIMRLLEIAYAENTTPEDLEKYIKTIK